MRKLALKIPQALMALIVAAICTACDSAVQAKNRGTDEAAACCPPHAATADPDHDQTDHAGHDAEHAHSALEAHADDCGAEVGRAACAADAVQDEPAHKGHDHAHGSHQMQDGVIWCGAHDVAEMECGICQPQRLPHLAIGDGLKVRLPSVTSIEKAGLEIGSPVVEASGSNKAALLGEITFNRNALAVVSPLATGVVESVSADVGDRVEAGALLAMVRAPEIAEAKAAYLDARSQSGLAAQVYAREKDLHARGISARKDFEEASAALRSAQLEAEHGRQHLANLGLTEAEIAEVSATGKAGSAMPIRAPFAGTIVSREAVPGTRVEPGTQLFRVADLGAIWMELAVPEKQLANLREGSVVEARFEAYPEQRFQGELTWIGYQVDPQTRLVQARAVIPNERGLLRAGMFGEAFSKAASAAGGLSVPQSAIQNIDGHHVVFTQEEADLFEARRIEQGTTENGRTRVLAGLSASDRVALEGSYILKSEFMKSKFGAGCAGH